MFCVTSLRSRKKNIWIMSQYMIKLIIAEKIVEVTKYSFIHIKKWYGKGDIVSLRAKYDAVYIL